MDVTKAWFTLISWLSFCIHKVIFTCLGGGAFISEHGVFKVTCG